MGAEEYTHTVKLQEDKLLSSKIDFLHRALLFEPLGEGRLEKIAHIARTHVYERGDTILEQGASVPTAAVRGGPPSHAGSPSGRGHGGEALHPVAWPHSRGPQSTGARAAVLRGDRPRVHPHTARLFRRGASATAASSSPGGWRRPPSPGTNGPWPRCAGGAAAPGRGQDPGHIYLRDQGGVPRAAPQAARARVRWRGVAWRGTGLSPYSAFTRVAPPGGSARRCGRGSTNWV